MLLARVTLLGRMKCDRLQSTRTGDSPRVLGNKADAGMNSRGTDVRRPRPCHSVRKLQLLLGRLEPEFLAHRIEERVRL